MTPNIRPACTVALLRDGPPGLEVLLVRRSSEAKFMGGYHVFPGGAVGAEDRDPRALARIDGRGDAQVDPSYFFAAVRETFEEAGILLVTDAQGAAPDRDTWSDLHAQRGDMCAGRVSFADLLVAHGLVVPASSFLYFDHWLTPAGGPRRFDTRFLMARAPAGQEPSPDGVEIVDARWVRPEETLAAEVRKELKLANSTRMTLTMLAPHATVNAGIEAVLARGDIEPNRPCTALGSGGARVFHRHDAPYHEIHWCDPDESMQTTYELAPGVAKRLDRYVARIVAPNPGPMTGPGTNTYFVGERELAVVDPGPLDDSHLAALLAHGAGRIRWILCTHTHRDHSPAAAALAAATGAQIIGMPPPPGARQDETFAPQRVVRDGEVLQLGDVTLTAIHTPGHASNHVCYRLHETGMLFTGDHVMQGSTVVIAPPDGNMRTYLASLERLLAIEIAIIAPGHGYLIGAAHREVRKLIQHRLWREGQVRAAVARRGPATVEQMLDEAYPDLRPVLRGAAAQSLTAHLQKLVEDGVVSEDAGRYRTR